MQPALNWIESLNYTIYTVFLSFLKGERERFVHYSLPVVQRYNRSSFLTVCMNVRLWHFYDQESSETIQKRTRTLRNGLKRLQNHASKTKETISLVQSYVQLPRTRVWKLILKAESPGIHKQINFFLTLKIYRPSILIFFLHNEDCDLVF